MATTEIAAAWSAGDRVRPYAPSWLDRLLGWIEGLPGPTWFVYVALIVPSVLLSNSALWLSGLRVVPEIEPAQVGWGIALIGLLAASHRLKVVAGQAWDQFRPALGTGVADPYLARYELTVMPARPILGLTIFSLVITPVYYGVDPVASQVVGLTPLGLVPRILSEGATTIVLLAILYQAIRQMRIVGRLHAAADSIDPFRPGPVHAFSVLTAQAGLVLIGFNTVGMALNPAMFESSATMGVFLPWLIGFTIVACVVFVVPLLGMHRRLAAAKLRLQADADERLKAILAELNRDVDTLDLTRADGLQKTLTSLLQQRDVLARLHTGPWSAGTIRGFGSALLLPLVIYVLQRFVAGAVLAG